MFQSSSLLLAWGLGILALQHLDLSGILQITALVWCAALWVDATLLFTMLRRVRWLLMSVVILFLWMTPGVFLTGVGGDLGVTIEGALAALEHVSRLLAVIALLALLLSRMSHGEIVSGLYTLLAPLGVLGVNRRSMAVRLMLTLEYVSEKELPGWLDLFQDGHDQGNGGIVYLPRSRWQWGDGLVWGGVFALGIYWGWQ